MITPDARLETLLKKPPLTLAQWYANVRPMLIRIASGLIGAALFAFVLFTPNFGGLAFALTIAAMSLGGVSGDQAVRRQGGSRARRWAISPASCSSSRPGATSSPPGGAAGPA